MKIRCAPAMLRRCGCRGALQAGLLPSQRALGEREGYEATCGETNSSGASPTRATTRSGAAPLPCCKLSTISGGGAKSAPTVSRASASASTTDSSM
eukprot:scaffold567_cov127-Isochrysis_galbana.AAC.9